MRRLTYLSRGELRWDEAADPVAPEAGAVVRPIASTTCDLDRAIVAGATPFRGPFAIGHEAVAEVVEVGSSVTDLRPGVVVAVPWHICCGRCRRCSSGLPTHCLQVPRFAMYGLPLGGDFGGLFDDLVLVPFAAALVPVPEGVDPVAVASASDNLTDAYRAVEPTLRARPGADVLVLGGTGSIGFYCVAWARFLGAARLDYFDTRDDPALAARLGATVITELPDHDTDGYDLVIDAAADAQVLARGLRLLAPGGHCHSVGIYFGDDTVLPLGTAYMTGMSFSTGRPQVLLSLPDVLAHVAAGAFDPREVFSDRLAIADAPQALAHGLRKPVFVRS